MNAKEKVLKEMTSASSVNTQMIREQNRLITDMETALVVRIEDQTGHKIHLSQAIIQNEAFTCFNAMKAARGEETSKTKKSLKLAEVDS